MNLITRKKISIKIFQLLIQKDLKHKNCEKLSIRVHLHLRVLQHRSCQQVTVLNQYVLPDSVH